MGRGLPRALPLRAPAHLWPRSRRRARSGRCRGPGPAPHSPAAPASCARCPWASPSSPAEGTRRDERHPPTPRGLPGHPPQEWRPRHLLDGHGGPVLVTGGHLVQQGAQLQAVEGPRDLVLVEAQAVQQHGLPQVLHGGLQPVRVLLDVRQLHMDLAAQLRREAGGQTVSRAWRHRGCPAPRFLALPSACLAARTHRRDEEEGPADPGRSQRPLVSHEAGGQTASQVGRHHGGS